jgi:hypothetical protein
MTDTVPHDQRIDRPALERIIRRAAELQAAEQDIGSGLSETDLMHLGSEVGIPAPYLQQAMLEERTQAFVGADSGFRHWLAGPQYVIATRTVPLSAVEVERALHHWMTNDELLVVKRRADDYMSWEPKRDLLSTVRRDLNLSGKSYTLAGAREITAQVSALRDGRAHVRLVADLENSRQSHIRTGGFLAVAGAAATVIGATLGVAELVAVLPALGGGIGGFAWARSRRGRLERMHVALEQVLDRLERNEIRVPDATQQGSPIARIADEVRRNLGL